MDHSSRKLFDQQISPIRLVLAYVGFAVLWIIASGIFLTFTVQNHVIQGYIETGKGLLFVVVTAALLYHLIKRKQARIRRLTHLYAALSQCNQAIVWCKTEEELLPRICREAVRFGGMKMAWIGKLDEASGQVVPVASYGDETSYLDGIRISALVDEPWGRGPTGVALRENRAVWCQDFATDPLTAPWSERARQYGWGASATLPLLKNGVVVAFFTLYAGEKNAFDSAAQDLLAEMAMDIGFGLENFTREAERRQAEEALRNNEAFIAAVLDSLLPHIAVLDENGTIIAVNRAWRMFAEENAAPELASSVLGMNYLDICERALDQPDGAEGSSAAAGIRAVLAGTLPSYQIEYSCHLPHGERWFLMRVSPLAGLRAGAVVAHENMTERKLAERRLQESEARHSTLFTNNCMVMLLVDPDDGQIVDANLKASEYYGWDRQTLRSMKISDINTLPMAQLREKIDQVCEWRKKNFEFRHRLANGVIRDVEIFTGPVMIGGRRLILSTVVDITERHLLMARQRALLALNELGVMLPEQTFFDRGLEIACQLTGSEQAFLHQVPDGTEAIEFVAWSQLPESATGKGEPLQCTACEERIMADCLREKKALTFNDYAAFPQPAGAGENRLPFHRLLMVPIIEDGQVRLLLCVTDKRDFYDDADVMTLQMIGNDLWRIARRNRAEIGLQQQLAELKILNQKLEETHNLLVQSEKMAAVGQLSAGIAHEINNPISFIQSNFNALSEYLDQLLAVDAAYVEVETHLLPLMPEAFEPVHRIKQAGGHDFIVGDVRHLIGESRDGLARVGKIVQNLKDFSRVGEAGWQWADLHQGISSTLNIVRTVIRPEVEIDCEFGELPLVRCTLAQLNQVFLNLLVNAAQSIEGAGHVVVRTGCSDEQVWIEVRDSGIGIAPEDMKRLFTPFFTTKPVGKGMGLGLSLSWGIIQRHKGKIEVDSTPGKGSVFRVILPVEPSIPADAPEPMPQQRT